MPLTAGARLGSYEITGALGAGGMGEVYRATDTRLGREVALKVLPKAFASDPERLARFEREARLLASLNHPNIAHLYGFETATLDDAVAVHVIAMELVEGEDLAVRLKRGPLAVDEAVALAIQMAEALEAAHAKGIVHRDLKPANVKLTVDGQVKVLDFGLAKAWSGDAAGGTSSADLSQSPTIAHTGTAAGLILGTAAYMSPEQARGKAVDKRADIWAFGVVLFEMLSGRPMFAGDTVSDVLAAVLKEHPPWQDLPAGLPSSVRRVLERCLVKNPRDRLHDIADARIELQGAPQDAPPSGDGGPAMAPPRPAWHRVAMGLLCVLIGGAVALAASRLRERPLSPPRLRFTVTPPGSDGQIETLRFFRDGRRFVYTLTSEQRLLIHDLDGFESRPVGGTEGATAPFLSPDGRWIGFYQGGKIRKVPTDGGDPKDICGAANDSPGAAWGAGDVILFSPTWTGVGLWRVSADGGQPVALTKPDRAKGETGHFWPHFLPDGHSALFTIFGGQGLADSKVGLLDLESGRYLVLFEGAAPAYLDSGHILYYRGGAYRTVPFDAALRRVTGAEATVLPGVRRLDPVGSAENYVAFSPSGAVAYVESDSTLHTPLSKLAWVSRNGTVEELPFEGYHSELSLSPDGTRVAVDRFDRGQKQVYVHDLARGTTEQLTRDGQNWGPRWHPDGRRIAVNSQLKGNFDVRRVAADGTGHAELLLGTDVDEGLWEWAPGGESALFAVWSPVSGKDLWHAQGDGSTPAPLLASPLSEDRATLSPDGKWLAYIAEGSLYVDAYPSLGNRVLIAPLASFPRWNRAAAELFYVSDQRLAAVPYEVRGGFFRPGTATTLFPLGRLGNSFDVAPDGRRFLFFAPSRESRGDRIRVVLTGYDELAAGGPAKGQAGE